MQQQISQSFRAGTQHEMSTEGSATYSKQSPALKNMGAFHELMRRNGFAMPELSSKFINQQSLFMMYSGTIY